MAAVQWSFEADYLTACNCDWGCPCNFNARPTQGNCNGIGAWRIKQGAFGSTQLDGAIFVGVWFFPGLIEEGNGRRALYIDAATTTEQRQAIEGIVAGKHGGGIFEIFSTLVSKDYPTRIAGIEFVVQGGKGTVKVDDALEFDCDLLSYPDGSTIRPFLDLPDGIEFKRALATNAKRWWVRDEDLLGFYENKYGAVSTVKFNNNGCVG